MTIGPARSPLLLACAAILILTPACASKRRFTEAQARAMLADKPEALQHYYQRVVSENEENYVLYQMEAGLASLAVGERDAAKRSFDAAIAEIETVYAGAESAEEARGLFEAERSKIFKGEPYERMMVFYYRGLLYLEDGDPQNARASFKNAMLQDAIAEVASNRADAAFLAYLEGWASRCNGDDRLAQTAFREAATLVPGTRAPARDHDLLIIVETGSAPEKFATGKYLHELRFRRGDDVTDGPLTVTSTTGSPATSVSGNMHYQAATRGGREIDKILEGQVEFKETAYGTADAFEAAALATTTAALAVSVTADSAQSLGGPLALAGLGLQVASMAADAIGEAVNPEADTRFWQNLPGQVQLHVTRASPDRSVEVTFEGADGLPYERQSISSNRYRGMAGCRVVWTRSTAGGAHAIGRHLAGSTSQFEGTRLARFYGGWAG